MKKLIYFSIINLYLLLTCIAGDKQMAFLTTVGSTITESRIMAFNAAYMQDLKIISKTTTKSGDNWVTIAKVAPR